jgi:hypothetical protein
MRSKPDYLALIFSAGWAVIFWLAAKQAIWLTGWGPSGLAEGLALGLTALKYWVDRQSLETENQQRAAIRLLVLLRGKIRKISFDEEPKEDVDLPLWTALQTTEDDWSSYISGIKIISISGTSWWEDTVLYHAGAIAQNHALQRALETLDRAIIAAARTVGGHPAPGVIFGLRKVLLRHAAERFLDGATKQPIAQIMAIRSLSEEMNKESAVSIFLNRVAVQLGWEGHLSTYLMSWDDVISWLKNSPPEALDDLSKESGNKIRMQIPEVLRQAVEHDRIYKGGKTYDG